MSTVSMARRESATIVARSVARANGAVFFSSFSPDDKVLY